MLSKIYLDHDKRLLVEAASRLLTGEAAASSKQTNAANNVGIPNTRISMAKMVQTTR
jgi:hypothetical protein